MPKKILNDKFIAFAIFAATFCMGCQGASDSSPASTPIVEAQNPGNTGAGFTAQDLNVLSDTNQARKDVGNVALVLDPTLNAIAEKFAADMYVKGYFSHVSPNGTTSEDRLREGGAPYGWAGENIATGYATADSVVVSWMNSPGHKENILNSHYRKLGVGQAGRIWVQIFTD